MSEQPEGILLTVSYDGTPFAGFAPQPNARTIAGELLGALRALDPSIQEVRGASRTDAGVHARGQRVAFDPKVTIPPRGWVLGSARHLPDEIAVRRAAIVPVGTTPRFSNRGKTYRYTILRDPVRDPFFVHRAWRLGELGGDDALARARAEAASAVGTHDFSAFRSAADERTNTVRTMRSVDVEVDEHDPRLWHVVVAGNAFLHNMVRILVGTIVDVARGRLEPGAVQRALASRERTDAGTTAPAEGLCLEWIELADEGREAWPEPG